MTAHTIAMPQRRGACPGLSAPMPTGDGLLVRLLPIGTVPLAAFIELCAAARRHGNGVVEITSRGSIQLRGLSETSAPQFAAKIATLKIAADDGVPIHCNALTGIDAEEILDAGAFAAVLRDALARQSMTERLAAKTSLAIDGGGALDLATVPADVRLSAQVVNGDVGLRVGVGGDDARAVDLGLVAPARAVETAMRLLDVLARRGRDARARDILAIEGATVFRSAIAALLKSEASPRLARRSGETIGLHRLRDGSAACGIGLAFGHADAISLERLADAATAAGATGFRFAPGRALLAIGLTRDTAHAFAAAADGLGFITRADDPRRHVVACAGAPICASAHIAARVLAPLVADKAAAQLGAAYTVHISGCAKGCAHAAPAALTVVGTPDGCTLVDHGSTRDQPFAMVPTSELPAAIAKHARGQKLEVENV